MLRSFDIINDVTLGHINGDPQLWMDYVYDTIDDYDETVFTAHSSRTHDTVET